MGHKRGRPSHLDLRSLNPNPNPNLTTSIAGDEDGAHRRRLKKLLLAHNSASPASDSDDRDGKDLAPKVIDTNLQERGPTTSLPDKKLFIILDKLQKKDAYGVYSEPVDPNELPDYHDIIEHPMDLGRSLQMVLM